MPGRFTPQPITLEGPRVTLVPLSLDHAIDLADTLGHPNIFHYMPCKAPEGIDDMRAIIRGALDQAKAVGDMPFAIIHAEDGKAVGSTRFIDVQRPHRGLEIGWTWVGLEYQRTFVNTECKYLLLKHAFDDLGALRVQLKTDSRNENSQKAILRIGAKKEGVLRNHMLMWDGHIRHTAMFSIIHKEWKNDVGPAMNLRLL
ncbi:MAG: GNAT family protein [Candidatus Hydrogenedentota bacterium]